MHCCASMAEAVELAGQRRFSWPPALIWSAIWDEYRIGVADLNPARGVEQLNTEVIAFCPFCGTKLRESKRDRWHAELYGMGFHDPGEQDIPPEYEDSRWWADARPDGESMPPPR